MKTVVLGWADFLENHLPPAQYVIGYTRLLRRTIRRWGGTGEGKAIIANCKTRLVELLGRVDKLTF